MFVSLLVFFSECSPSTCFFSVSPSFSSAGETQFFSGLCFFLCFPPNPHVMLHIFLQVCVCVVLPVVVCVCVCVLFSCVCACFFFLSLSLSLSLAAMMCRPLEFKQGVAYRTAPLFAIMIIWIFLSRTLDVSQTDSAVGP